MLGTIHRLWGHLRWADTHTLQALQATATPASGAITEYAHILGADETWLARLEGRAARVPVWPTLAVPELAGLAARVHDGYDAYLSGLDETELGRRMSYTNSAGRFCENAVLDTLLHVSLHAQYHRGKLNLLLRESGVAPVPVDYIQYIRALTPSP
jgi:uncharacterized damage-inducible protein DinB